MPACPTATRVTDHTTHAYHVSHLNTSLSRNRHTYKYSRPSRHSPSAPPHTLPLSVTDRPITMSGNSAYHWPGVLSSALDAVGCTPLIRLDRIAKEEGLECNLRQSALCNGSSVGNPCADTRTVGKCEFFSVGGSVKDRIAKVGGYGPRRGDPR